MGTPPSPERPASCTNGRKSGGVTGRGTGCRAQLPGGHLGGLGQIPLPEPQRSHLCDGHDGVHRSVDVVQRELRAAVVGAAAFSCLLCCSGKQLPTSVPNFCSFVSLWPPAGACQGEGVMNSLRLDIRDELTKGELQPPSVKGSPVLSTSRAPGQDRGFLAR